MSNSIAVQIADALAGGISAYPFSAPSSSVTAARLYVPDYQGTELSSLKVSVVPGAVETERSARGQDLFTHTASVVVAKHVDGTNGSVDALTKLCEEIIDAVRSETLTLTGMPAQARYWTSSMQVQFDRDALTDRRVFLAQIDCVYRVPRDHVAAPTGATGPTGT